jgi:DNA-binding response OmpR family regulator
VEGLRILLAEDHRDLHFAMRQMLEQLGVIVESAYDGRSAVATALSGDFDAVLMDLRMPGIDGLQATRELRRQGYAVPIVALTADPATVRRAEALDAGCDECFSKPFRIEEVLASIRRPGISARRPSATSG